MSNLPDYSEVERLRLQLHHAELQRDAFKAMANKAVTELIREVLAEQNPRIHGMDIPDPHTFRYGVPADPAKVAAYAQPNKGTEEWMKAAKTMPEFPVPGVTIENLPYVFPAEPTTPPFRISDLVKRVETLEEDGNIVDGIIDRVSQRTDTNRDNIDHLIRRVEDLEGRADGAHKGLMEDAASLTFIRLTLERMDARLNRLEANPHG